MLEAPSRGGAVRAFRADRPGDPRRQPSGGAARRIRAARHCGSTCYRTSRARTSTDGSKSKPPGPPGRGLAAAGCIAPPAGRMPARASRRYRRIAWARTSRATSDSGWSPRSRSFRCRSPERLDSRRPRSPAAASLWRGGSEDAREPAGPRPVLRRRDPRPRRLDRRLQLPGRVEHGLARGVRSLRNAPIEARRAK